jgi:hypothetical protein
MKSRSIADGPSHKGYLLARCDWWFVGVPIALFSLANLGRILGILMNRTARVPSGTTAAIIDKDRAVGLVTPPEEEKWECVVSW